MEVKQVSRDQNYFEPPIRRVHLSGSDEATDEKMEKTSERWGVKREDLEGVIGATFAIQEQVRGFLQVFGTFQIEEEALKKAIQNLEAMRQALLGPGSGSSKLQQAQEKLALLEAQLSAKKTALETATTEKTDAATAFYKAVAGAKKKAQMNGNRKARLNQEWPNIQSTKTRTEVAHAQALKEYEACVVAVREQELRIKSFKMEMGLPEIEANIKDLQVRIESSQKRSEVAKQEIEVLSAATRNLVEDFIVEHIKDSNLHQEVRDSLHRLRLACLTK
jgi:hypothetical protein